MVLRYKQILHVCVYFVLLGLSTVVAQELTVSIRPYDEDIYFPDSDIYLYVSIRNDTAQTHRFRLADDRSHNLDFLVYNHRNEPVSSAQHGTTPIGVNQVYYRTVALEPGDHFSFVESLNSYINIDDPGLYTVSASFFPELRSIPNQDRITSNTITLAIRPGETPERRIDERFEAVAERQLSQERLAPDETVERMIQARREGNWERFFLYLNLESLYRQNPDRNRRYTAPSVGEMEQRRMLDEYKEELRDPTNPFEAGLSATPSRFRILQTSYTPTEGTVVAELGFDYDRYREVKRYTYDLQRRRNGYWEVIGYSVTNLENQGLDQ